MAEINTGLGWAASDLWLVQSGNAVIAEMSSIGGSDYPNQPIARGVNSLADCLVRGIKVDYRARYGSGDTCFASVTDVPILIYASISGNTTAYTAITTSNTARVARADSGVFDVIPAGDSFWNYDSATGLYTFGVASHNTGQGYYVSYNNCPVFASSRDALDAVSITNAEFTKTELGYAVACLARWKTGITVIETPILISSVSEYTNMTVTPDPGLNFAKLSILRNGIRYYMSFYDSPPSGITTIMPIFDATGDEYPDLSLEQVFAFIADLDHAAILELSPPDPYGDTAEEDGGEQTDPEDNPVEEETMPIPAVVGLGFSTIYVPTQADLYNLAAYLWGGNLDLDNFLKLFANPMDSILGLSAVPLVLSGTYEPIYLGGQQLQGITMPRYTGRTAVKVDMGTITIKERWGAYLDYDPYTELAVYIPFVGIKNIKADDVMGKTIRLMYDIDILSGACIAYIRPEGGSPLYEWSGQCAMQIPITGANWDNIFSTAINTAATLGGALFAPASAPVLSGAVASAASQAIAAKPRIERSGAVNGITGFLGQLRPYIIRTIPEAYIPNDQNKFIGYPSYVSINLGQLAGYNEIASIHLENIPATQDELSELESILKGGVIF